jgi:hypothetical protein
VKCPSASAETLLFNQLPKKIFVRPKNYTIRLLDVRFLWFSDNIEICNFVGTLSTDLPQPYILKMTLWTSSASLLGSRFTTKTCFCFTDFSHKCKSSFEEFRKISNISLTSKQTSLKARLGKGSTIHTTYLPTNLLQAVKMLMSEKVILRSKKCLSNCQKQYLKY